MKLSKLALISDVHSVPCPHAMQTGSPHARYSVVHLADGQVEQFSLPNPWHKAAAQARRHGRPEWER